MKMYKNPNLIAREMLRPTADNPHPRYAWSLERIVPADLKPITNSKSAKLLNETVDLEKLQKILKKD